MEVSGPELVCVSLKWWCPAVYPSSRWKDHRLIVFSSSHGVLEWLPQNTQHSVYYLVSSHGSMSSALLLIAGFLMELWAPPLLRFPLQGHEWAEGRSKMKHSYGPQPSSLKEREMALFLKPPFLSEVGDVQRSHWTLSSLMHQSSMLLPVCRVGVG